MLGRKDPQGRFFDHYVYERHLPRDHELVRIHKEVDFSFVGAEKNVQSLLEKEREQGLGHQAVVADALYDSAENRRTIHEEKISKGERLKAYIPSRQKEKWLDRFRYVKEKDREVVTNQGSEGRAF